jgi:hypothetical protein
VAVAAKAIQPEKQNSSSFVQELEARLEKESGKSLHLDAHVSDIGAELLSILSKGLYTNPLDSLREYAQNGVDAGAKTITIKITGNAVTIFDDGAGMDLAGLLEAKKFGLSPKSMTQHVGFRGIGIYSGFDLCRRLLLVTKKAGDAHVYEMSFEFEAMKAQLDTERLRPPGEPRTSLIELLSKQTKIALLNEAELSSHYTHVHLMDISPAHIALLSNRQKLQDYLLGNLPIDFSSTFKYASAITQRLNEVVSGYNPVRVKLQLDGHSEEAVEKYTDPDLDLAEPIFSEVHNTDGKLIAFYWACLNRKRGRLTGQYEGLIYKVKGFSVGDRNKPRPLFLRPQLYPWYTGEIYVLDPEIVPNAERNDFETSVAKQALEAALLTDFNRKLRKVAEQFQAAGKAGDTIIEYERYLSHLDQDLDPDPLKGNLTPDEQLDRLRQVGNIIDDLPKRRRAASTEMATKADALLALARRLQKVLTRRMEDPASDAARRKKANKDGRPSPTATASQSDPVPEPRRLGDLFLEAGWQLDGHAAELIDLMQDALDDLVSRSSAEYARFIEYFSQRLSDAADQA